MNALIITAAVLLSVLIVLVRTHRNTDVVIWSGVGALLLAPVQTPDDTFQIGVIGATDALAGLSNPGVVTIAALFIVAAGMRETGALSLLTGRFLGATRNERAAQHRILWPTALLSLFFNNTPLVALLMPVIDDWGRRYGIAVARLLMPLSFATILGGACTLIGTSTNLVINGWLIESTGLPALGMFSMTPLMAPVAIVGILFVIYASPWLLPARSPVFDDLGDAREYVVEMEVEEGSELAGRTIDEAGLRGLPGLFLVEIERAGTALPAVSSNVRLAVGDHLVFAGIVDSVVDLQRFNGLRPATDQVFKLDNSRTNRHLIEAVVSDSCPLVGQSIRGGRFRTIYNAAVIAVARNGERVQGKIGNIVLRPGDVLLLEARPNFLEQQRNRRDFYLVSEINTGAPQDLERAPRALVITATMIVAVAFNLIDMLHASLAAALLMLASKCLRPDAARRAIDWELLLVIAGALTLGKALEISSLATTLGHTVTALAGASPWLLLTLLFVLSAIMAGVITAKASAILMLPVAYAAAGELGISFMPCLMAVMLASSMAVATPIGYPTNLMVFGPGGYRFGDYLRLGGPLTVLIGAVGLLLIPRLWPF